MDMAAYLLEWNWRNSSELAKEKTIIVYDPMPNISMEKLKNWSCISPKI